MPVITISRIDRGLAAPFIARWHYSGKPSRAQKHYFGAFVDGELRAVASYGRPPGNMMAERDLANEIRTGCRESKDGPLICNPARAAKIDATSLLELSRVCRVGEAIQARAGDRPPADAILPMTKFLATCHELLRSRSRSLYIISYSDPYHSHAGGLYRAMNFRQLPDGQDVHHCVQLNDDGTEKLDKNGLPIIVHRRIPYKLMLRRNIEHYSYGKTADDRKKWPPPKDRFFTMAMARAELKLAIKRTKGKHRWLLKLKHRPNPIKTPVPMLQAIVFPNAPADWRTRHDVPMPPPAPPKPQKVNIAKSRKARKSMVEIGDYQHALPLTDRLPLDAVG